MSLIRMAGLFVRDAVILQIFLFVTQMGTRKESGHLKHFSAKARWLATGLDLQQILRARPVVIKYLIGRPVAERKPENSLS